MGPIYVIGGAVFLAVLMLTVIGAQQATAATGKYEQVFTDTARVNLTDMFIFIDPKKLFVVNIVIIVLTFLILWLFTGYWILALVIAIIVGLSPRFLWRFLKARRNQQFIADLPDTLMSLSSMMKAGTNLNVALETVVRESRGPVAQEFGLFMKELRVGVEFHQALENLQDRMPIEEVNLLVAAMKISREIGGSLAEVLYRLAETLRRKLEMEGKINSLTAQGKAQGWVMAALPVLLAMVLYKMEPEAMSRLFTEPIGWLVCAAFCVFEYLGYFFIKKIVTIDV